MRPAHVGLAVLVAVIWGFAFVATRIALDSFSPPQLAAARFLIAAVSALVVPAPRVPWSSLASIGLTLFAGQFLFQFFGIANGVGPGLASIVVQTQAFFTVLFAGVALGERPTSRQVVGMTLALIGLVLIALTTGHDLPAIGFGLTLVAAVSWGIGNVLLKQLAEVPMLNLIVWLSLVPPLPSLVLSLMLDGPDDLQRLVARVAWLGLGAAIYLGLVATLLAYAIWAKLLRTYPAATVTPFALLVPFVAAISSAIVFGEAFGPLRLTGMAAVLLGLAVVALPLDRRVLGRTHGGRGES